MHCDNCHKSAATESGILMPGGKFGNYCSDCRQAASRQASGQSAQWHRDRDHEDHRRDMIQPKGRDGKINPEFVRAYPEEAAEMFTQEDINKSLHNV